MVPLLYSVLVLAGAHMFASGEWPSHMGGRPCQGAPPHASPSSWSSRQSTTSTSTADELAFAIADSKLIVVVLVLAMFLPPPRWYSQLLASARWNANKRKRA